ncbi:phosphatidate cytidylyltransferase [Sphingobacterium hungaricum]
MKTRAITGFFFIAVVIGAILLGDISFVLFFSILAAWSTYEFYTLVSSELIKPLKILGVGSAVVFSGLVSAYFLGYLEGKFILLGLPFLSLTFILPLFQKRELPFNDISYTLSGLLYAAFPFVFFIALGFISGVYNPFLPLGYLIILWSNDTGAYLAGRSFGKRKLFERISPNKTWEGFIGGLILAAVVALNLHQYFGSISKIHWVCIALIISIFGTLGDLVESMLKRSLNVKDSGKILPGHGGLLDRFDGLLISTPLVYLFLIFV